MLERERAHTTGSLEAASCYFSGFHHMLAEPVRAAAAAQLRPEARLATLRLSVFPSTAPLTNVGVQSGGFHQPKHQS